MEARNTTAPRKAEATERQPTPIRVPFTLLGAFDLAAVMAVAWMALRDSRHKSPAKARRPKDT
jgi:hypothetical protein